MSASVAVDNLTFTNQAGRAKTKYKLHLDDTHLHVTSEDNDNKKGKTLSYNDIIGVKLRYTTPKTVSTKQVNKNADLVNTIDIYAYPSVKPLLGAKCTRKRVCTTLILNEDDSVRCSETLILLQEAIECRLIPVPDGKSPDVWCRFPKPILVLLNPASGKGQAKKLFEEKIVPVFKEAKVPYEFIITEKKGHGAEIAHDLDLQKYYGLVIVSGDGLLYEVYQGLLSRTDSHQAVQTPVGILPAGSGNALCCSINYDAGEPFKHEMLIHSLHVLVKHRLRPMDLISLDTADGNIYSFLSVTWGLVADVDIDSERFRNLGNARFTVEAIYKIIKPKTYRGRLSFLPAHPYTMKGRSKTELPIIDREPESNGVGASSRPRSASAPHSPSKDMNTQTVNETGECNTTNNTSNINSTSNTGEANNTAHTNMNGSTKSGPAQTDINSYDVELPSLTEPVPSNWVTMEDSFITFIASYQSHIGPTSMPSPTATFSDGLIHLLIIRAPLTRMQMLNLMGQLETGEHVRSSLVDVVAVKAFRLEPEATEGHMVVDGEKIKFGPIQGRVLPGLAKLMAK